MNIHTFGQVIPYNYDNLPEWGYGVGAGTDRPVGFPLELMARLYWTVNSFNVNVAAVPLFDFSFETFLLGGGATSTLIGATVGMALMTMTMPVPVFFSGKTKSTHITNLKVRQKDSLNIDQDKKPNYLVSKTTEVTEGSLVSSGPYHSIVTPGGACFINFSNIIYFQRLYWPQVMIFAWNPSLTGGLSMTSVILLRDPLFSASLDKLPGVTAFKTVLSQTSFSASAAPTFFGQTPTIGNINFLGAGIPLFGVGNSNTYAVFGQIGYFGSDINAINSQSSSSSSKSRFTYSIS